MKRFALTITAMGLFALMAMPATAADNYNRHAARHHAQRHANLNHNAQHRAVQHHNAHHNPMSYYQHNGLHRQLNHQASHDRARHHSAHDRGAYAPVYRGHGGHGVGISIGGASFYFGH